MIKDNIADIMCVKDLALGFRKWRNALHDFKARLT